MTENEKYFPLLNFSIKWITFLGLNPKNHSPLNRIRNYILVGGTFLMSLMMSLEILLNWNGIRTLGRSLLFLAILMIFGKCVYLTLKKDNIGHFLDKINVLWRINIFGKAVEDQMKYYADLAYKFIVVFKISVWVNIAMMCLKGIYLNDLPLPTYTFCDLSKSPCYEISYTCQFFYLTMLGVPTSFANESLFASMILYGYIGIQMLKSGLRHLFLLACSEEDEFRVRCNIRKIVLQHNIILSVIKDINDMFSEILFVQFSTSLSSQIFCLFMLTVDGSPPDMEHIFTYGIMYIAHLLQLSIYCVGGSIIMNETSSIGDAAYDVAWYNKNQTKLRKTLSMIIMRSHRTEKLTIGDMVDLNLVTYLAIIRNSLSMYALLQTASELN